jgi:hypothetical protein
MRAPVRRPAQRGSERKKPGVDRMESLVLSFSDDAMATLMRLAEPIDRELRDPFLRAVATELRSHDGEVVDAGLAFM